MKKFLNHINEMVFDKIPTNYLTYKSKSIIPNLIDYKFDFITKKGNEYSVYVMMTKEDNLLFDDNTKLSDVIIPTILFSETKNGLNPLYFNNLTNKNEFSEVMGKVIFIILDFINKHPYNIYSIGEVNDKKLNFYNHYKYHFNSFDIKVGNSTFYTNENGNYINAYYLIKNNLLCLK